MTPPEWHKIIDLRLTTISFGVFNNDHRKTINNLGASYGYLNHNADDGANTYLSSSAAGIADINDEQTINIEENGSMDTRKMGGC